MPEVNDSIPKPNNPVVNPQQGGSFTDSVTIKQSLAIQPDSTVSVNDEVYSELVKIYEQAANAPTYSSPVVSPQQSSSLTDSVAIEQLLAIQPDSTVYIGKEIYSEQMYGPKSSIPAKLTGTYMYGEGQPREYPLGSSWAYLPTIGVLLLTLLLLRYTRSYFHQLFLLVVSHKVANKQYKANIQNFNRILLITTLFAIIPATIFAVHIIDKSPQRSIQMDYEIYLLAGGILFVFYILKSIILFIAGVLTYSEELIRKLRYSSRIFLGSWGITVLPFILLLILNDSDSNKTIFFYITAGLSILFFCLYLIRSFQLFLSERVSVFFWILYLCMLELLPALLVFNYLFSFK